MLYQVKQAYRKFPELVTTIDGKAVGLNAEIQVNVKPTKLNPGYVRTIPKATGSQLRRLYEEGNPLIECVDGIEFFASLEKNTEQVTTKPEKPTKKKKGDNVELH